MGLFNFGQFNKYNFKTWANPFDISNVHHSCLGNNVLTMLKDTRLVFVNKIYRAVASVGSFLGQGRAVVFSRGRYIVGTLQNGIFYTDNDGAVFVSSNWPTGVGTLVFSIAANSTVVCAMGGIGMRYSVDNGVTFNASAVLNPAPYSGTAATRSPNCMRWVSEIGRFVIVGGDAGGGRIAVSLDGNSWQQFVFPAIPSADALQAVAYFKNKIYVAGYSGGVYQLNTDFTGLLVVNSATATPTPNSFKASDLVVFGDQLYLITGNDSLTTRGSISVLGGGGFNLLYTAAADALPLMTGHSFNGALHVIGRSSFVRNDEQLPV